MMEVEFRGLTDRAVMSQATRLLPRWGGGLVLHGYAAAAITTLNRDVT